MGKVVALSLGSNVGDRLKNVENGLEWLKSVLTRLKHSDIYETPEIHGLGTPYFNSVVLGECQYEYEDLNLRLKQYELECGRTPEARKRGDVVIDIDIVEWDGQIIRPIDWSREFYKIGRRQLS